MALPTNDVEDIPPPPDSVGELSEPETPQAPPAVAAAPSMPDAPPSPPDIPEAPPDAAAAPADVPPPPSDEAPTPPDTPPAPPGPEPALETVGPGPAPAPEPVAAAPVVEQPQATAVQPAPAAAPPQVAVAAQNMQAQAAADGMEGLDFDGFGVFPIITLQGGEFDGGELGSLGTVFYGQIQGSRAKFIITNGLPDDDPQTDFRYTYDLQGETHKHEDVQEVLNDWERQGWKRKIKQYLEVPVKLRYGRYEGTPALLSIPPASRKRFTSYYTRLKFAGKDYGQVVTKFSKAPKIEGPNIKFPWNPWGFDEYVG